MIKYLVIMLIRGYQLTLSRILGPRCRFYPSCSHYAIESIQRFGIGHGLLKTTRRVLKCHPFHPGGIDPVGDY